MCVYCLLLSCGDFSFPTDPYLLYNSQKVCIIVRILPFVDKKAFDIHWNIKLTTRNVHNSYQIACICDQFLTDAILFEHAPAEQNNKRHQICSERTHLPMLIRITGLNIKVPMYM